MPISQEKTNVESSVGEWLYGKHEDQKKGTIYPRSHCLPGAEQKPHWSLETLSGAPFPHVPNVAQCTESQRTGGDGATCPGERHSWSLPLPGPGRGLHSCSLQAHALGTSRASAGNFAISTLQVPKWERAGQLSAHHKSGLPGGRSMVTISCPCHQDQRMGLPGSTPHRPNAFPSTHLSQGWSHYSHTCSPVQTSCDRDCRRECLLHSKQ